MAQAPITKSIDVGSMFLMDMSVCESELACELAGDTVPNDINSTNSDIALRNSYRKTTVSAENNRATETKSIYSLQTSIADCQANTTLSSSIDIIASIINSDSHQGESTTYEEHSVAAMDSQPPDYCHEPQSYSLSDESFVASSGTSLSASYTVGSEPGNEDRDSTTTREDSGVLDMKDLEGQLFNSYDNECDEKLHNQHFGQKKPISSNIKATNLINKSATKNNNDQQQQNYITKHSHRLGKPTEGHGNDHNHISSHSKRSISASVPIQVPVRQMRKDLNKLKLKLMKDELKFEQQQAQSINYQDENEQQNISFSLNQPDDTTSKALAWDEDDETFLDQEYNENHHNHYPLNYDDEHPRAGDDPMKLFASIQALAKSLHEDAELFGSLPPKRLLESPIRSIALV